MLRDGDGAMIFRHAFKPAARGIVSKRADSPYHQTVARPD
jgi:ATP-dependent DNA ligase